MSISSKRKQQAARTGAKRNSQITHALARAKERFGIELEPEDLEKMVESIQSAGEGPFQARYVKKQSNRVSVYRVTLPNGNEALACYDKVRKMVATVLPPDARV